MINTDSIVPTLVGVRETCTILSLKRTSVFALLKSHQLTRVVINRRTLVTVASIEALIERATVKPHA